MTMALGADEGLAALMPVQQSGAGPVEIAARCAREYRQRAGARVVAHRRRRPAASRRANSSASSARAAAGSRRCCASSPASITQTGGTHQGRRRPAGPVENAHGFPGIRPVSLDERRGQCPASASTSRGVNRAEATGHSRIRSSRRSRASPNFRQALPEGPLGRHAPARRHRPHPRPRSRP